jgi:hypothetical protein
MVNKELIDYIKSIKEKGYPDEAIKAHLLKFNYTQEAVDEAFRELQQPQPLQPPIMPAFAPVTEKPVVLTEKTEKKRSILPIILIIVFAVVIISGAALALLIFAPGIVSNPICESTAVDIYRIRDEPVVCIFSDNSKLQFIIVNSGTSIISKADVTVKGSKGNTLDTLDNLDLAPTVVFPRTLNYDYETKGDAKEITVIPYASDNGKSVACYNKKISYDTIGVC